MTPIVSMDTLELINALYDRGLSYGAMARLAKTQEASIKKIHRNRHPAPLSGEGMNGLTSHLLFLQSFENDEIDKSYYYEEHLVIFSLNGILHTAKLHDVVESGCWNQESARQYILSLTSVMDYMTLSQCYPQLHEFKVVTANDGYQSIIMDGISCLSQDELIKFFPELTLVF